MREFETSFPLNDKFKTLDLTSQLRRDAAKAAGVKESAIGEVVIIKKSIDARGNGVLFRYKCEAYLKNEQVVSKYVPAHFKNVANSPEVIVVGAGPAGLFAALKLIELGFKPVVIERGKDVHQRKVDIASINRYGIINPDSSYCFGEGGAGTFSDGKLYTRSVKRGNVFEVLSRLTDAGAVNDIFYDAHPHIGTDKLPGIVENIRKLIESYGGVYHFDSRVEDFIIKGSEIVGVKCSGGITYTGKAVVLATGHSSRDIYQLLFSKGIEIESKGFALGVRVEHPQSLINKIQYHGKFQPFMPNAEYSLAVQSMDRGVFSFCMCPGGTLVPASTTPGELVLNGMSNSQRNSQWANAGVVVSINPGDIPEFDKYGVLSLLQLQMSVEKASFEYSGGNIIAPAQRITDFLKDRVSTSLPKSSYHPGTVSAKLSEILPDFVFKRLKEGLREFDRKMRGYITEDAILLATESRTSSPIRITRDPSTMEHIRIKKLVPCGEGSGYSGGIVSSAIDGINAAKAVSRLLNNS